VFQVRHIGTDHRSNDPFIIWAIVFEHKGEHLLNSWHVSSPRWRSVLHPIQGVNEQHAHRVGSAKSHTRCLGVQALGMRGESLQHFLVDANGQQTIGHHSPRN
jgi:hypothetical protein